MDPLKRQRKTLKSLASVAFNPAEVIILLAAPRPVAVNRHAYSARRLFYPGRRHNRSCGHCLAPGSDPHEAGDQLVTGRREELT